MLSLLFLSLLSHAQVQYSAIGNSMIGTISGTMTGDRVRMTRYQITEAGWLNTIAVYVTPGSSQKLRGVIYDDMKRLKGFTSETTIDETMAPGWIRLKTHQPIQVDKNSQIYVGIHSGLAVIPGKFRFTPGGGGRTIVTVPYLDGPPQTVTTVDTTLDGFLSIYAIVYHGDCPNGSCLNAIWNPSTSPDIDHYEVGYGPSRAYDKFVNSTGTSALISGLSPNTTYCVAVRAYNAQMQVSPWSNEICNTTLGLFTINTLKLN